MSRALFRLVFIFILGAQLQARAGLSQFTDHAQIDFDTVMQLLNPYGTWVKGDDGWSFTPLNHEAPYTDGRWLYTDYGWYWQGKQPYAWATEHYGYWKRGEDHVWSWYPGPDWLAEIVELRTTSTHVGWRCAAVDADGKFVEAPADRYAKTDEWTFVSNRQFTGPITPNMAVAPEVAAKLLDESSESTHSYLTYRAIERPGPHPADFQALAESEGMFAPLLSRPNLPTSKPGPAAATAMVPAKPTTAGAETGLALDAGLEPNAGAGVDSENQPPVDPRQVPYWTILNLPTYWASPPADAKPNAIYIYRPDLYQDHDGIQRRIGLWLNPSTRPMAGASLSQVLGGSGAKSPGTSSAPEMPGEAATPVMDRGPFRSPFDDSFHPATTTRSSPESNKGAPSGLKSDAPETNAPSADH